MKGLHHSNGVFVLLILFLFSANSIWSQKHLEFTIYSDNNYKSHPLVLRVGSTVDNALEGPYYDAERIGSLSKAKYGKNKHKKIGSVKFNSEYWAVLYEGPKASFNSNFDDLSRFKSLLIKKNTPSFNKRYQSIAIVGPHDLPNKDKSEGVLNVYSKTNQRGQKLTLKEGEYSQRELQMRAFGNFRNSFQITSMVCSSGYRAVVFRSNYINDYERRNTEIGYANPKGEYFIGSSIRVEKISKETILPEAKVIGTGHVTVYSQKNYAGKGVRFEIGKYTWSDLEKNGISQIRSVKVDYGYKILLDKNQNYHERKADNSNWDPIVVQEHTPKFNQDFIEFEILRNPIPQISSPTSNAGVHNPTTGNSRPSSPSTGNPRTSNPTRTNTSSAHTTPNRTTRIPRTTTKPRKKPRPLPVLKATVQLKERRWPTLKNVKLKPGNYTQRKLNITYFHKINVPKGLKVIAYAGKNFNGKSKTIRGKKSLKFKGKSLKIIDERK